MNESEIKIILENHKKWLNNEVGSVRANLSRADLKEADLIRADLSGADLIEANLIRADLREADLSGANLIRADLREANLREANLSRADLREADLIRADLRGANLIRANLRGASLIEANLSGADLREADLENLIYNENTAFYALCCPEKGDFVGYKKASNHIVELLIMGKRSSATSRKCRCSEAKVLSITNLDGTSSALDSVESDRDNDFIYKIGEVVKVDDFDDNRWNECSTGIHFFITREEAVNYDV